MNLPLHIAWRYLFAKKSHNVINIISTISAIGMAIGTAALIVILSVYNGFSKLVEDSLSSIEPDIRIEKQTSKVFSLEEEDFDWLKSLPGVASVEGILEENVFLSCAGRNGVATVRGMDTSSDASRLREKIIDGKFVLFFGDIPMGAAGAGLAFRMGINPRIHEGVEMYFPDRHRAVSLSNPAATLRKEKIWVSGIFSISSDVDESMLIVPLPKVRSLLGYDNGEVSALEVRVSPGCPERRTAQIRKEIEQRLGEDFAAKDRFAQNATLYKMMRSEKAAVFLILIFVVIIIAFNIFGSLSMLMIEKGDDIGTLRSLGATDGTIRKIFILEGWMISLLGLASGLLAGVSLVLLQQSLGLVGMPGAFAVNAYPVVLSWSDVALISLSIAAIGYLIALIPTNKYLRELK